MLYNTFLLVLFRFLDIRRQKNDFWEIDAMDSFRSDFSGPRKFGV